MGRGIGIQFREDIDFDIVVNEFELCSLSHGSCDQCIAKRQCLHFWDLRVCHEKYEHMAEKTANRLVSRFRHYRDTKWRY